MANTAFSALPTITGLDGTEQVPLNQAGTTKTATTAQIARVGGIAVTNVSNLPSAVTSGVGTRAFVTDATVATFHTSAVGGGSNKVPVYSDGTGWFIG